MLKHYKIYRASEVALVVKNMSANAGDIRDVSLIPGLERCPGGGHGNPLQFSWASLVSQIVKNLLEIQETWVLCLGERNGNPVQYSCLENPTDRRVWWAIIHGISKGHD